MCDLARMGGLCGTRDHLGAALFLHKGGGAGSLALRTGVRPRPAGRADTDAHCLAPRRAALFGPAQGPIVAFGLIEFAIPFSLISLGERWISSSVTGILIAMVPLSIALIQRFFGIREALGGWRIAGLVVGFVGVAALLGTGPISGVLGWAGVGCMLVSTLCYAVGPLIIQRHLHGLDSIGPLAASLGVASAILLIPAALEIPSSLPSANALASIAVLGILCTAVAMLLMFYLVHHAGASRASVITYINPVVATLLGVLVLDEHLGIGGFIAFALILLGSWLATRGAVTRSSSPHEAAVKA